MPLADDYRRALSALLAKNTILNKLFRSIYFLPVVALRRNRGRDLAAGAALQHRYFHLLAQMHGLFDVNLLNNTSTAIYVVVFVAIWKTFGISAIILVAAIQNIPDSLFEASALDGAGKVRQFFSVTLPSIMPSFWFLLMTRIIGSCKCSILYTP